MSSKVKQLTYHENIVLEGHHVQAGGALVPETGVTLDTADLKLQNPLIRREKLLLTDLEVDVLAANDFGSTKLFTFPANNILFLFALLDLTAAVAGFAVNTVAAVDIALGTAAIAAPGDFTNAGEDDITLKIDGVGAAATGTIKGVSDATLVNALIAAGTNAVYANVADGVTTASGTGVLTLNGLVEITYLDLSKPSA